MADAVQYNFEIQLSIWTDSGQLIYHHRKSNDSMDIEFTIPFDNTNDQSVGEIVIWNMSQISFNRVHEGDRVQVIAGYSGDTGILFDGFIYKTTVPTIEGGDHKYTLRVVEGTDYRKLPDVSLTFGEGTAASTIIDKIVSVSGINLNNVSMREDHIYSEGFTVDGSPLDALAEVAGDTHSALFYRRGQLTLRYMYDDNNTGTAELNNGSGLISSPTMERRDEDWVKDEDDDGMGRYQYSAESLLNYRITTGEYVHIQSMFVNITGTVISGEHAFDGTSPTTSIEIGVK